MKINKLTKVLTASTLLMSTLWVSGNDIFAKGGVSGGGRGGVSSGARSSSVSRSSSKPSSSTRSSKPSASLNPNKPNSRLSNNRVANGSAPSSVANFNPSRNSYNNNDYKERYGNYLHNNYSSSGFFSGNNILNTFIWFSLFNSLTNNHHANAANEKQKELVDNLKSSNTPVYMLEIKTKSGETKYITVTKEQYQKIKENDNITIKNGELEIKK